MDMRANSKILLIFGIFTFFCIFGCGNAGKNINSLQWLGANSNSNADFAAVPAKNRYAVNFLYTDYGSHIKVVVNAPGEDFLYYLYRGAIPPAEIKKKRSNIQYIKIPVQRIVSLSSENLVFLEALSSLDKLAAVDKKQNIANNAVKKMVESMSVKNVGEGRDIDIEMLYMIKPDIILTSWTGSDFDSAAILRKKDFSAASSAGWLEPHPLGRAEWVVFLSLFLDMEADGRAVFEKTVMRYEALKNFAKTAQYKPVVFFNMVTGGKWDMPAGESYIAKLLEDAGALFPWADVKSSGSMQLDFEAVYNRAGDADFWFLNTAGIKAKSDIINADNRYALFKAYKEGSLYNNDALDSESGNPYWAEGSAYPDRILSDFINIFHKKNRMQFGSVPLAGSTEAENSCLYYFRQIF